MLPDVMEHDELQTGERREGTFTAYLTFFRKLGSALAILVVNFGDYILVYYTDVLS